MKAALWVIAGVLFASGVWYYVDLYNPEQRLTRAEQHNYREKVKVAETQLAGGQTDTALDTFAKAHLQHQETVSRLNNPTPPPVPFIPSQDVQPAQPLVVVAPVVQSTAFQKKYGFRLDGADLQQTISDGEGDFVRVRGGDKLVFDLDPTSHVCERTTEGETCSDSPLGRQSRPEDYSDEDWIKHPQLKEYPVRTATLQQLVMYLNDTPIPIAHIHFEYIVRVGTPEVQLLMGHNVQRRLAEWRGAQKAVTGGAAGTLTLIRN